MKISPRKECIMPRIPKGKIVLLKTNLRKADVFGMRRGKRKSAYPEIMLQRSQAVSRTVTTAADSLTVIIMFI